MLFKSRFQGSRRGRSPRRSRRFIPLALERLEPYLLISVGDYTYSFTITSNLGPETQGTGHGNAYRSHPLFLPLGGVTRLFDSFETTWSIARSFSGSLTLTDVGTPDGPGLASATIPFSGSLSKNGPLTPSGEEVYHGSVPLNLAPVYEVLHGVSYEVSEFVYNYQWSITPPDNSSNIYIVTLLDTVSVVVGSRWSDRADCAVVRLRWQPGLRIHDQRRRPASGHDRRPVLGERDDDGHGDRAGDRHYDHRDGAGDVPAPGAGLRSGRSPGWSGVPAGRRGSG